MIGTRPIDPPVSHKGYRLLVKMFIFVPASLSLARWHRLQTDVSQIERVRHDRSEAPPWWHRCCGTGRVSESYSNIQCGQNFSLFLFHPRTLSRSLSIGTKHLYAVGISQTHRRHSLMEVPGWYRCCGTMRANPFFFFSLSRSLVAYRHKTAKT